MKGIFFVGILIVLLVFTLLDKESMCKVYRISGES